MSLGTASPGTGVVGDESGSNSPDSSFGSDYVKKAISDSAGIEMDLTVSLHDGHVFLFITHYIRQS